MSEPKAAMTSEPRRRGIVLADGDRTFFVAAHLAERVAPIPEVTRVPGSHADLVGVALVDGIILPVVSIGGARAAMLVVDYLGEPMGIVGAEVLATGAFDTAADGVGVRYDGRTAEPLDLRAIYERLQAGSWAGRSRR